MFIIESLERICIAESNWCYLCKSTNYSQYKVLLNCCDIIEYQLRYDNLYIIFNSLGSNFISTRLCIKHLESFIKMLQHEFYFITRSRCHDYIVCCMMEYDIHIYLHQYAHVNFEQMCAYTINIISLLIS